MVLEPFEPVQSQPRDPLRILHCFRAPVGGLFRHVCDLAREQVRMGHKVGLICDATTGGEAAEDRLAPLHNEFTLGIHRVPMGRQPGISDLKALNQIVRYAKLLGTEVLHGHGAKGGAYARFAAQLMRRKSRNVAAFYTPHGGTLHYEPNTLEGRLFFAIERHLETSTAAVLFESAYAKRTYEEKIGPPRCPHCVIHNGLLPSEFTTVEPAGNAADFVFIGELRTLKGVDVLIEALGAIETATLTIIGGGPDGAAFKSLARKHAPDRIAFFDAEPARRALSRGRCLVVPSRAESLPYIVLEAAAAAIPVIAAEVGGIPEILPGQMLVEPDNAEALARKLQQFLKDEAAARTRAAALVTRIEDRFSVERMAEDITGAYVAFGPALATDAFLARTTT